MTENKNKKYCFLVTYSPYLMEFFGKLAKEMIGQKDECFLMVNSKIAEYSKLEYFPENIKVYSRPDWSRENYKKENKEFEGISWKEVFPDFCRNKLYKEDYQDWLRIVNQIYQFVDFVLEKEKPDAVFSETPGGIFSKIVHLLCQKHKISYLGLAHSRFPGRIDIRDENYTCSKFESSFKKLNNRDISAKDREFAKAFAENFISHKKLPNYIDFQISHIKKPSIRKFLKKQLSSAKYWFRYLRARKKYLYYDHESERMLKYWLRYPKKVIRWRLKALLQRIKFGRLEKDDKFLLFPLHVQPEHSTGAQASYYYNQLNTANNIAFALPIPYKLYVKEHPLAFEGRTREFYEGMKRLPNVVFLSPKEKTEELIKRSKGVVVLTSTIGMEAAMSGKPVYVLGNVFWSYHPMCQKINGFDELKDRIENDLAKGNNPTDIGDINIRFILSYYKNTLAGDIYSAIAEKDTNDYKTIYQEIKRIFL
jgi:esterase/lipase